MNTKLFKISFTVTILSLGLLVALELFDSYESSGRVMKSFQEDATDPLMVSTEVTPQIGEELFHTSDALQFSEVESVYSSLFQEVLNDIELMSETLTKYQRNTLWEKLKNPDLYAFLQKKQVDVIKNDILNKLRSQANFPPEYIKEVSALFQDENTSYVLRDYCIQHLTSSFDLAKDDDREEILKIVKEAALTENNSIGGTGLISMAQVMNIRQNKDREFQSLILSCLQDKTIHLHKKISAIQVATTYQLTNATTQIAIMLQNPEANPGIVLAGLNYFEQYPDKFDHITSTPWGNLIGMDKNEILRILYNDESQL